MKKNEMEQKNRIFPLPIECYRSYLHVLGQSTKNTRKRPNRAFMSILRGPLRLEKRGQRAKAEKLSEPKSA